MQNKTRTEAAREDTGIPGLHTGRQDVVRLGTALPQHYNAEIKQGGCESFAKFYGIKSTMRSSQVPAPAELRASAVTGVAVR